MQNVNEQMKKLNEQCFKIEVEVLDGGKLPHKAHASDAGWDVFATSDITIYPGQVVKHPLNIKFALPVSTWGEITTKSGLGSKGLLVYAGVIDEAYRGIPHVVFTNLKHTNEAGMRNDQPIVIKKGEKLAQFIMNPYSSSFYMVQVDNVDGNTDRGVGGFGSTGK
jgi:dUTP pyrophosphatase